MLDDSSPASLFQEAVSLARQLRFVQAHDLRDTDWATILRHASEDWSGFLGDVDGPIFAEFKRFFDAPDTYVPESASSSLAAPHRALFVAFLRILQHARAELNAFPKRHLDHYFREVLRLRPLPAQGAEVYVTFELGEDEAPTFLPAGTRLVAGDAEDGEVYATTGDLEVTAAKLSQVAAVRTQFAPAGFRKLLEKDGPEGGMATIRTLIWARGPQQRLQGTGWGSFDAILADMDDREMRKAFPDTLLQVSLEEFRQMMAFDPAHFPLDPQEEAWMRKWEQLHARMVIAELYPSEAQPSLANAKSLRDKLSVALFNGTNLPDYRGKPVKLDTLFQDMSHPESPEHARAAMAYLRGHLYLEEKDFQLLYDLDQSKQGIPRMPEAILEATVRKASSSSPMLLRQQVTQLAPTLDTRTSPRNARGGNTAWFPYGGLPEATSAATGLEAYGLIIASPVLALAEGQRTLQLTLTLEPTDFEVFQQLFDLRAPHAQDWVSPFSFYGSTDTHWLELDWRSVAPQLDSIHRQVTWTLALAPDQPALTRPGAKFQPSVLAGMEPMLHLRPNPPFFKENHIEAWSELRFCQSLMLSHIQVRVAVEGIMDFQAENHEGEIKISAPFEPFGSLPASESAFMVAHPELCLKPLDSLRLEMEWMEMPADLKAHYDPYFAAMGSIPALPDIPHAQEDFVAAVELVAGRWGTPLAPGGLPFLKPEMEVTVQGNVQELEGYGEEKIADFQVPTDWPRYLRLLYRSPWSPQQAFSNAERRLTSALLRAGNDYAVASQAYADDPEGSQGATSNLEILQNATAAMAAVSAITLLPPYVPKLKWMKLGYTATLDIPLAGWQQRPGTVKLFHQLPFGLRELPLGMGSPQPLLPAFHEEGTALLGFQGLWPGQRLSLLLKVQPGSGNPDAIPPAVKWAYHSTFGWRPLPAYCLLQDDTRGLLRTGLLHIAIPDDAAPAPLEMGSAALWLRASADLHCDHLPHWEALHTQAMHAKPSPSDDGGQVASSYLPAGSVTSLEGNHPSVAKVMQPYPSYNGRAAESDGEFYQRVSERLRHKNRALAAWDLEHLCLQQFPHLYAVKTLQAAAALGRSPGEFRLVVVPDLRKQQFADTFQPKFGYGELSQMADYLKTISPPSAMITLANPRYRPVLVGTTINFKKGVSSSTGKYLLQQCLCAYLAPWAYDEGTAMGFGGRLYASDVVDLLQAQPYVEFVGKTRLFIGEEDGKFTEAHQPEGDTSAYIEVSDADVLTSVEAHLINEISEDTAQSEIWEGISWMVINSDFEIEHDPNAEKEVFDEWLGISWMVIGKDFKVSETKATA